MSDATPGAAAPTGGAAPAVTPPAATEPKPQVKADDLPPEALKARLESAKDAARREMLAELGVTDTKNAKEALAELKRRQDAEKTEQERLAARVAELEGKAAKADHATQVAARRAAAELSNLSDAQRAYVTKAAGDDPLKQLETIDTLRETGLLATAPAAPAAAPPTPGAAPAATPTVAAPAPTSTAPAPNAPPQGSVSQLDHKAIYAGLNTPGSPTYNPFAAAAYLGRFQQQIFPGR